MCGGAVREGKTQVHALLRKAGLGRQAVKDGKPRTLETPHAMPE